MSPRRPRGRPPAARAVAAALALALSLAATLASTAPAVAPRASLPAIESQVMCTTCKIPLIVAQSAQADRERAFISRLIAQGQDTDQIKHALVGQYGRQVLTLPATHGFELAAYLVPIAAVGLALLALVLLLPRWRRRGREQRAGLAATGGEPTLGPADTARLEADLARFD